MEWATLPLRRFAQFSGRSRRKEYWMFFLLTLASFVVASIIDNAAGLADEEYGVGPVYGLVALGLFIPSLAVSVRRLHDTGRSGWWLLLSLIPLGALVLLYFYASGGEAGANRFGPDPKAGGHGVPA